MKRSAFLSVAASLVAAVIVVIAIGFVTVRAADQTMPAAGQVAPTFTLPSQDGSQISLDSFRGKWVVLYFYPKDMTPGCTIEAHNFQRDLSKYEALDAVIVGVSVDTPDSHKQFCTKEGLTFRLLPGRRWRGRKHVAQRRDQALDLVADAVEDPKIGRAHV